MALAAAFLVMLVCGGVLMAGALAGGLERRSAAAYATATALRHAAQGAVAAVAGELEPREWDSVLAGASSAIWAGDLSPSTDAAALTALVTRETMAATAHGADTPVWQVFVRAPWVAMSPLAGASSRIDLLVWVADDWDETDGDPRVDSNARILVRAAAVQGRALAWSEAVFRRNSEGAVRPEHQRAW